MQDQKSNIEVAVPKYPFTLPQLRYGYGTLEPYMDAKTLEIHHGKHHETYIKNLNAALKDYPELHDMGIEDLLRNIAAVPEKIRQIVRNQGGGHANHQFLWKILSPAPNKKPEGAILAAINQSFSSFEKFKTDFTNAAINLFGSGWVFLVVDLKENGKLRIFSAKDHDSVLYYGTPGLLICDVWEHAYYLKHQNRRPDYLEAYWNLVDWSVVDRRLEGIKEGKKLL
jgi:Fe-Mn family superoxide dismutase